ncbi:hypothetical protein KFE25_005463 [Diacronema lutheri]|uniref:Uncharacterized protein n=1 Tax=Diacronema lutheri TaxID=2081491 RepID=A0A8J6CFQ5_DIALT|nr:hypothetical protein KFE25_005463 [Diacronema lutheri]
MLAALLVGALSLSLTMEDGRTYEVQTLDETVDAQPALFRLDMDDPDDSEQPARPCPHHDGVMMGGGFSPAQGSFGSIGSLGSLFEGLVEQLLATPSVFSGELDVHPCAREMALTGCSLPSCLMQQPEVLGDACASLLLSRSRAASVEAVADAQAAWAVDEPLLFGPPDAPHALRVMHVRVFSDDSSDAGERDAVQRRHHHHEQHDGHSDRDGGDHHHGLYHHGHHHATDGVHAAGHRYVPHGAREQRAFAADADADELGASCLGLLFALTIWALMLRLICRCFCRGAKAREADVTPSLEPLEAAAIHKPHKLAPAANAVDYKPKDVDKIDML